MRRKNLIVVKKAEKKRLLIKDQYPKASQSVIQKAEYEKKKFGCGKKS